jgi:glycosyltransferase involved in cell wall biosynthesis
MPVHTIVQLSSTAIPGGAEMVVSRLAAALNRNRFRSIVCLFHHGWLEDRCRAQGVETHIIPIDGMFDWRWGRAFVKFLKANRVSLVHTHEFTANTYGAAAARVAGIPVVATIHGKSYFLEHLKRRLAYRVASQIATMVAVSEDLKQFVCNSLGIATDRLHVVYNGVPILELPERSDCALLLRELGVPADHKIVGVIASLYPVKGHKYLLQAIPEVIKVMPKSTFLIVGRGELDLDLRRLAKELDVERYVRFLGFRNDVLRFLRLIDLFVLPSLSEGLSIAVLEAMAAGKPVVATRVGGNPELIVDGETGFLVPPMNADALASQIIDILKDETLRVKMGNAGHSRAINTFSLKRMVDGYEELYEQCIEKGVIL